ncbi:MAG TPA: LiaF domain-containing protein [Actinomycetota bacterium]|nr:LiaF domain-containing protein [Actinomycetota bacterium]
MRLADRTAGGHPAHSTGPMTRHSSAGRRNNTSTALTVVAGALGVALVAWAGTDLRLLVPALLSATGVILLAAKRTRLTRLLVPAGLILIALIFLQYVTPPGWQLGRTFGSRSVAPQTATSDGIEITHVMGTLHVDLTETDPEGAGYVSATIGAGTLVVTVPAEVDVQVKARAGIGSVNLFGQQRSVLGATLVTSESVTNATEILRLDLSVGAGSIEVRR